METLRGVTQWMSRTFHLPKSTLNNLFTVGSLAHFDRIYETRASQVRSELTKITTIQNFLPSNTGYLVTNHTIHVITYLLNLHHPGI